uniref:Uncharacterized protein n=1 Tax=Oryza sativa subsp. japonica TaxID=39947 RepID=Q67W47_ORYSJ|nr:hypothetical protein [Oryza sativa Japonica Group]
MTDLVRAFSGPIVSIVPPKARGGSHLTPEPPSPKVSCIGQIKKANAKKADALPPQQVEEGVVVAPFLRFPPPPLPSSMSRRRPFPPLPAAAAPSLHGRAPAWIPPPPLPSSASRRRRPLSPLPTATAPSLQGWVPARVCRAGVGFTPPSHPQTPRRFLRAPPSPLHHLPPPPQAHKHERYKELWIGRQCCHRCRHLRPNVTMDTMDTTVAYIMDQQEDNKIKSSKCWNSIRPPTTLLTSNGRQICIRAPFWVHEYLMESSRSSLSKDPTSL